jgi:hypothetical protein
MPRECEPSSRVDNQEAPMTEVTYVVTFVDPTTAC